MSEVSEKLTPMMKQFVELKSQYSDCILLFRAGDFYETFFEDAQLASELLGITLTKRGTTPMAGVPFHSINPYIKKLVQNNRKVALCEQLEDPKKAKGLVKRGVTRVITPGTILEDEFLSSQGNNFVMCVAELKSQHEGFGISLVDISTGEFYAFEVSELGDVFSIVEEYSPQEIIKNEQFKSSKFDRFIENKSIFLSSLSERRFSYFYAKEVLKKQFKLSSSQLDSNDKKIALISCGALLFYIYKLQKFDLDHINSLQFLNFSSKLILDSVSLKNLEVLESLHSKDTSKTLFGILNNCKTSVGSRLLKRKLSSPSLDQETLEKEFDAIEELLELSMQRGELRELLGEFYDIERITSRISSGLVTPKDLYSLRLSLEKLPEIKHTLILFSSKKLQDLRSFEEFPQIVELLRLAIKEEAPAHTRDLGYLKPDYTPQLKELYDISFNSKGFIAEFEAEQRELTGISTLKIKYNRVFGYYIEVPKSQVDKVPAHYITRQTLANNQRYTTNLLKEKEDLILGSQEKMKALEKELYEEIIGNLKEYIVAFQKVAQSIAQLDVLITHSLNAQLYNYVRPQFSSENSYIEEGRNPIVEQFVSNYIPNTCNFTPEETLKIVTGPNMAGKSTYLRQTALISIMAQAGSFVPAKKATLKLYDRVFTRIGAHDEIASGQSTFMVEMSETANILQHATKDSLVVLDEIGRGTSTYDGLAIAWSITEELAARSCDTIFATHYHQLNQLSEFFEGIENYNVLIREEGDSIEFLHKIVRGGTDKSYGLYVGKLAGIPESVLSRAKEVQKNIQEKETIVISQEFKSSLKRNSQQKAPSSKPLTTYFKQ